MNILKVAAACALFVAGVAAAEDFKRTEDVIYGRKFGTALTLDVFTPAKTNGLGIVFAVSGGFYSDHSAINTAFYKPFLDRGYTVFAVVHGSQPKFTIPEILNDMHRAVRFIRYNAGKYGIDGARLGITGASAGGHLSLMQGLAPQAGNKNAPDPIDRISSGVQAVACFFPPTDFLNYGKPGEVALGNGTLKDFKAPFDFTTFDGKTKSFALVTDAETRKTIGREISPVTHAGAGDAPTLIIHGDADFLVPIQQAEIVIEKLTAAKVPCKLVRRPGAAHGWPTLLADLTLFADWFDEHLKAKKPAAAAHSSK